MIEFMKSHYYDPYVAQYVHPKKEFKVKMNYPEAEPSRYQGEKTYF